MMERHWLRTVRATSYRRPTLGQTCHAEVLTYTYIWRSPHLKLYAGSDLTKMVEVKTAPLMSVHVGWAVWQVVPNRQHAWNVSGDPYSPCESNDGSFGWHRPVVLEQRGKGEQHSLPGCPKQITQRKALAIILKIKRHPYPGRTRGSVTS